MTTGSCRHHLNTHWLLVHCQHNDMENSNSNVGPYLHSVDVKCIFQLVFYPLAADCTNQQRLVQLRLKTLYRFLIQVNA